jgi:lysophospholipase L1-like esterase
VVLFTVLLGIAPASASPSGAGTNAQGRTYLALGDSVPFGYRGGQTPAVYADPANFVGYPELVARDLHLRLLNASCPGETSASFIDANAQSNNCENTLTSPVGYRDRYPLHVAYAGSQLDYARQVLTTTPHVRLVTLMLGANDLFLCQQQTADRCTSPAEVAAAVAAVQRNVAAILDAIRETGYTGRLVVVTYYTVLYNDPTAAAVQALNAALAADAADYGASVADGFDAFRPLALAKGGPAGSSILAGLVLPRDVHPTPAGQCLLAQAVEAALPATRPALPVHAHG